MNKKGFTLIETILVILIMTLILLIIIPNIFKVYNEGKIKECNNMKKNIINAAKIYVTENKYELNFIPYNQNNSYSIKKISLNDLILSGDLKAINNRIINPINNTDIKDSLVVNVYYDKKMNEFNYELKYKESNNEFICE